ncbi:ribbon-helix-helix protein, CopG family [Flexivirga caeni]|uniref:Ribbon-helix-helix protein, CopG family n=1 Tax=Flexivirga caeni TaxID=2294115 RepID=A0A3M9M844_9MICO|nr:ribbon-helix-helix protein, CopG family [Flexivirga caeni]RNI20718.1 ribbon-helix-helix protein, CopG family [Flexivirga caeni]
MSDTKTLAVRLDSELHARLTILAKLSGVSVTDAIRTAIEQQVEQMARNPEVAAKAAEYQEAITREADEQRAAIEALFGTKPSKAPARKGTTA